MLLLPLLLQLARLCDVDVAVGVPTDDRVPVVVVVAPPADAGNKTGSYKIGSDSSSNCRKRSNSANHKSRDVVVADDNVFVFVVVVVVVVEIRCVLPLASYPASSSSSSST